MPRATAQVGAWTKERIDSLLAKPASKGTYHIPKSLDYDALGEALEWAEAIAVILPEIADKALSRNRQVQIRKAIKLSTQLIKLLENDREWINAEVGLDTNAGTTSVPRQTVLDALGVDDVLRSLTWLATGLDQTLARRSEVGMDMMPPLTLDTSVSTVLVRRLKDIATAYLEMKVGVSRPSGGGPIDGPFVRFCEAFAAEVGTKLSGEVIAKALTSLK